MNNKKKYFNLALVWYELCTSRRVFSSSIFFFIFQIIVLSLILFILLHSVGSANKTYCDNDKFPLLSTASLFTHSSDPLERSPQAQMWQPHIWKAACSITQHYVMQWMTRYNINTTYFHFQCLHFIQESYLLFGWQDFGVARFASRAKLKIRNAKPGLACKHPDDMFTLYRIALTQAHGS